MTDEERLVECQKEIQRLRGIVREYENEENKIMNINIKKLNPNAIVPTFGTEQSAGMDLYALIDDVPVCEFRQGETKLIHTGIAVEIPDGYVGLIFARSGLASKRGLAPANKVGVIDSDYRGEIMVALHNHKLDSLSDCGIQNGERIAQLVIVPYLHPTLTVVDELTDTARGTGGFGSTGTK